MQGLVEAIEDFEMNMGLLLATCLISMKDISSLIKVLSLTDAPVTVYKNTKSGSYLENKQNIFLNEVFTNQNKPKISEPFQKRKHANLEQSTLNNEQKKNKRVVNETSTNFLTKLE